MLLGTIATTVCVVIWGGLSSAGAATRPATDTGRAIGSRTLAVAESDIDEGISYLLSIQNDDGGWGRPMSMPAITALVVKALVQHPHWTARSDRVKRGYDFMLRSVQDDGGIYDPKLGQANYTTSVAVSG